MVAAVQFAHDLLDVHWAAGGHLGLLLLCLLVQDDGVDARLALSSVLLQLRVPVGGGTGREDVALMLCLCFIDDLQAAAGRSDSRTRPGVLLNSKNAEDIFVILA